MHACAWAVDKMLDICCAHECNNYRCMLANVPFDMCRNSFDVTIAHRKRPAPSPLGAHQSCLASVQLFLYASRLYDTSLSSSSLVFSPTGRSTMVTGWSAWRSSAPFVTTLGCRLPCPRPRQSSSASATTTTCRTPNGRIC